MHPVDVEEALESMVVLIDTREQDTPALRQRMSFFRECAREKIDAGDYSAKFRLPSGEWYYLPVSVERKMDFDELAHCFCQQRGRFRREFERAKNSGSKLYLLVEGGTWEKAYAGRYFSKMKPQALIASILAWLARYNCQIIFCESRTTGKLIRDILYREGKEALLRLGDDSG